MHTDTPHRLGMEAPAGREPVRTESSGPRLARVRFEDEQQVASVLTRAFVDDPLVMAICPSGREDRQRRTLWSFRMAVRGHCLANEPAFVVAADGRLAGVVLVSRSRTIQPARGDLAFTVRGVLHVGARTLWRGLRAAHVIGAHAPSYPFTYLRTLGVAPEYHGRGLGSQLVQYVLRTSPPELPVYLETAKEENLAFYTRHGFERAGEFQCLGVPVWRLTRPPLADPTARGAVQR
jgi:ribosomal protein S18 acetylase RimI-like enzyme